MAHPITSTAAMGHSCLIQLLCERAGVEIPLLEDLRDEVTLHPTIDAKFITTQMRFGGEGYVGLAPGKKKVSESGEGTSAGSAAPTELAQKWMMMVEKRLGFLRRRLRFMHGSMQSFQAQMWSMQTSVCEAQGIETQEYHYHMYPHSDEEDAYELEVERMFGGSAAQSQAGEDAVPADGDDRDAGGEDEPDYSPMEHEDHGSHTVAAEVPPLALYDPTAADDDEEEE